MLVTLACIIKRRVVRSCRVHAISVAVSHGRRFSHRARNLPRANILEFGLSRLRWYALNTTESAIPPKTVRAWEIKGVPSIIFQRYCGTSTKSSGASAMVNATLNLKADKHRPTETKLATRLAAPGRPNQASRRASSKNVMVTINHSRML